MCITKVESYDYNGTLYPTEIKAVEAAVREIGVIIGKSYSGQVAVGMLAMAEKLVPLLARHIELTPPANATEVASAKSGGDPVQERARHASPHSSDGIGG